MMAAVVNGRVQMTPLRVAMKHQSLGVCICPVRHNFGESGTCGGNWTKYMQPSMLQQLPQSHYTV